ncbi:hypothetical protein ACWPM1_00450 [Tsuneonella sp. HG249]
MDCTIYEWEAPVQSGRPEARATLGRDLKRVFPVIVDEKFMVLLRALDRPTAG